VCARARAFACVRVRACVYTYVRACVCACARACMRVYACACACVRTRVLARARARVCVCLYACVWLRVCVRVWRVLVLRCFSCENRSHTLTEFHTNAITTALYPTTKPKVLFMNSGSSRVQTLCRLASHALCQGVLSLPPLSRTVSRDFI
jgi:hypothetical protein